MNSKKDGWIEVPAKTSQGIIGIQGQQGCNEYYYVSTGCTGVSRYIGTKNVTNIYNYLTCTGRSTGGTITPPVYNPPTGTLLNANFDHDCVDYQITVDAQGYVVPFKADQYQGIQPIINLYGSHVLFQVREYGIYEICYHVYLKEEAMVGARIRHNTSIIQSSVLQPDSLLTHLSSTCLERCVQNALISLELYSETDTQITLKGIIGASITIKRLTVY